jgi:beta-xylosidase
MLIQTLKLKNTLLQFSFIIIILMMHSCNEKPMYTNPVSNITDIGDPYVMTYEGIYYMYCTSAEDGFYVWTSDDMVNWEKAGQALSTKTAGIFGTNRLWAPEVIAYQGRFYMTYSAGSDEDRVLKLCLAVSDDPLGPFENYQSPWYDHPISHIDAHIFVEGEAAYAYFVRDCSDNIIDGRGTSQIFVARLSEDLKTFASEPKLILSPSQKWEYRSKNEQLWNEGPYVLKHKDLYYMTYSANVYNSSYYAVGYAYARSPLGPWVKAEENPILEADRAKGISGPGHNSFAYSPDGKELFMIYHAHTNPKRPSGDRAVYIDRVRFEGEAMVIDGPTKSPQAYPSGN